MRRAVAHAQQAAAWLEAALREHLRSEPSTTVEVEADLAPVEAPEHRIEETLCDLGTARDDRPDIDGEPAGTREHEARSILRSHGLRRNVREQRLNDTRTLHAERRVIE